MISSNKDYLNQYLSSSKDDFLKKWLAQHAESNGDMTGAVKTCTEIGDHVSAIRVHCQNGNLDSVIFNVNL
jgi:hypothetical protein